MINKRIVYTSEDGDCCIIIPAVECGLSIEDIAKKDVPNGLSYRIIDVKQLPQDRVFRNAWTDEFDTETVDVHIDKAKKQTRDWHRKLREPLLKKLDNEFMLAIENNNDKEKIKIIGLKKKLRDVTKVKLPDDIEELKYFIPDVLK